MQLGTRVGCHLGACTRRIVCPIAAPGTIAPPVIAPLEGNARLSVVVCAKRGSKKQSKPERPLEPEDEPAAEGWDAALANIPTEDDVAAADPDPSAPVIEDADGDVVTPETFRTLRAWDREAGEIYGPKPEKYKYMGGNPGEDWKALPTTITLAEFDMLMHAKRERELEIAEQKERERLAALGDLAFLDTAPLDMDRQGFQAFKLDGGELELLVGEMADGRLALADSYVAARGQQRFQRPGGTKTGGVTVPAEPRAYQVVPWVERADGDTFKRKEPVNNIKKLYFIATGSIPAASEDEAGEGEEGHAAEEVEEEEEGLAAGEWGNGSLLDLENVFMFDGKSQSYSRCEVRVVGKEPLMEPVLRIRPSGISLEEAYLLPDAVQVSMEALGALDASGLDDPDLLERMQEMEAEGELDELDEAPDVPAVDMV